jgi:putative Holliday junction resolvase
MPLTRSSILALDVGDKRVGVAVASVIARLPQPLTTLQRDDSFFSKLDDIAKSEDTGTIVVGLPRGLSGQETRQTAAIEEFVTELKQHSDLPIHLQDEAVTSKHAEAELEKSGKMYNRGDIDALAATYILEDFLLEHKEL